MEEHVPLPDSVPASYYACFDGHAGRRAAEFAAEHMHAHIAKRLPPGLAAAGPESSKLVRKAIADAFAAVDKEVRALPLLVQRWSPSALTCLSGL